MTPTDKSEVLSTEFPKMKYQGTAPDAKSLTVRSAEEEAALGEGWLDGHDYWMAQRERDEAPAAAPAAPATDAADATDATPAAGEPEPTPIDEPRK